MKHFFLRLSHLSSLDLMTMFCPTCIKTPVLVKTLEGSVPHFLYILSAAPAQIRPQLGTALCKSPLPGGTGLSSLLRTVQPIGNNVTEARKA